MSKGGDGEGGDQVGDLNQDFPHDSAKIYRSNSLDGGLLTELEHVAASMKGTERVTRDSVSDSWGADGGDQWKAPGRNSALLNMAFVTASESEGGEQLSPEQLVEAAEAFGNGGSGDGGGGSSSSNGGGARGGKKSPPSVAAAGEEVVMWEAASPTRARAVERAQTDAEAVGAEGSEQSEIGRSTMMRVTKRSGWGGIRAQLKKGQVGGFSPWSELRKVLSVGKSGKVDGVQITGDEIAKFNADPALCGGQNDDVVPLEHRRASLEVATTPNQPATIKKKKKTKAAAAAAAGDGGAAAAGGDAGAGGETGVAPEKKASEVSNHHPNASTHAGPARTASQAEHSDWRQLAGHADNFAVPDDTRYILKLKSKSESEALSAAMSDPIAKQFAVPFYGTATTAESEKEWMKIGNLLHAFKNPSLMDIKMGQRTYLHDKKNTTKKRMDLLEKMIKVDPLAPSDEERLDGVTKQRYMRFREEQSSSIELGFRIEAMHVTAHEDEHGVDNAHGSSFSKYFVPKNKVGVTGEIRRFLMKNPVIRRKFIERLEDMKRLLPQSEFFTNHEVIGSSLLFVYDEDDNATITMLDFGKTVPSAEPLAHNVPYVYPTLSHEEGYLIGVENILKIIKTIDNEGD